MTIRRATDDPAADGPQLDTDGIEELMVDDTVLVTGATGSVGRLVVEGLLARGGSVRALTRRPDSAGLPDEVAVFAGDLSAPETVREAADGTSAIFVFPAPDLAASLAAVAAAGGGQHAVVLSSASVLQDEPDASTRMHRAVEDAVTASGLRHTFVRPGAFMSNDLAWAPQIAATGRLSIAYPEAPQAPVAEQDIAAVAVAALVDPGTVPRAITLTGPESLSIRRRVATIADVVGRPIEIDELTPTQAREQMARFMPADAVEIILGHLAEAPDVEPTTPAPTPVLGRKPTTYRDWVTGHQAAFTTPEATRRRTEST